MTLRKGIVGLALIAVLGGLPAIAGAQMNPGMQAQDPHRLMGRVDSFDGHYALVVHGRRVRLHQGTVIHPTGATLRPGQYVIVRGSWVGHHFEADEIRIRG